MKKLNKNNFIVLFFTFISLFSLNAWALSEEELNQNFIGANERGPLKTEYLLKIESALHDLGMSDYLLNLQDKLRVNSLEGVASYVHACETEADTLGYYKRGVTTTFKQSVQYGEDLFAKEWGPEAASLIEKAYKHQVVDMHSYVALVIMEWPIICIRPNKKFASILSTFVHEVTHFVNDDELPTHYSQAEDEMDFVQKNLMSAGGEFEAYQASAKLIEELQNSFDVRVRSALMRFFKDGEVYDREGLKDYILNGLGYAQRFRNEYRSGIVNDYNQNITQIDFLYRLEHSYQQNLNVYQQRLNIFQRNAHAYKEEIKSSQKAVIFYQNMLTFTQASIDRAVRNSKKLQQKIDNARSSSDRGVIIRLQ